MSMPDLSATEPERAPATASEITPQSAEGGTWWQRSQVRALLANRRAMAGLAILGFFAAIAIFAPLIAPGDPSQFVDLPHLAPSGKHWFGTSGQGEDVFAQTVWGGRVSLKTGLFVGFLATACGTLVGLTAAYFGSRVDDLLTTIINVFLVLPGLPLLVALAAFLPPGTLTVVLVLAITGWAWTARVIRSQALSIREKDFTAAAIVTGENSFRIMLVEIMPNMASIVVGALLGSIIYGIVAEAGLEFLGLGDVSHISWGTNLYWAQNNGSLLTGDWWAFVPSGTCIAVVAFALALLNSAMDEVTNPRLRAERGLRHGVKRRARRTTTSEAMASVGNQSN